MTASTAHPKFCTQCATALQPISREEDGGAKVRLRYAPADVRCWPAGTGVALADWLRSRGHAPQFI